MSAPESFADDAREPAGDDALRALISRCAARAVASGGEAVVAALTARGPELTRACEQADDPADVLAAGLGLVMLECAGGVADVSSVGAAIARVAERASTAQRTRLSMLAAASGAFEVAASLATDTAPIDEPLAELAWCVTSGPLDGLAVPWRLFTESRPAPLELVLAAAAGQRRVHLLSVDRATTLDALSRDLRR